MCVTARNWLKVFLTIPSQGWCRYRPHQFRQHPVSRTRIPFQASASIYCLSRIGGKIVHRNSIGKIHHHGSWTHFFGEPNTSSSRSIQSHQRVHQSCDQKQPQRSDRVQPHLFHEDRKWATHKCWHCQWRELIFTRESKWLDVDQMRNFLSKPDKLESCFELQVSSEIDPSKKRAFAADLAWIIAQKYITPLIHSISFWWVICFPHHISFDDCYGSVAYFMSTMASFAMKAKWDICKSVW